MDKKHGVWCGLATGIVRSMVRTGYRFVRLEDVVIAGGNLNHRSPCGETDVWCVRGAHLDTPGISPVHPPEDAVVRWLLLFS